MEPILRRQPERVVAGISTRTNNRREKDPDTARIPGLWDRFYREGIDDLIPGSKGAVGVVHDYEKDHRGDYTSLAGVLIDDPSATPDELDVVTLAEGPYLVFRSEGAVPESVIDGWKAVWEYFSGDVPHTRSYTTDYEVYMDEAVEIHVAVEPATT